MQRPTTLHALLCWFLILISGFAFAQDLATGDRLFDEGDYAGAAAVYQGVYDAEGDGVARTALRRGGDGGAGSRQARARRPRGAHGLGPGMGASGAVPRGA